MGKRTGIGVLRLTKEEITTDHDLLTADIESHHPPGEHYRILINAQTIGAYSAWEHRETLTYDGHKTIRAILRGFQTTDTRGHTGVFVMGTDTAQQSIGVGIKPYGGSGFYPTTYMGGYSRIHGDAYLTPNMFGAFIRLRDVWVDGNEAVLEFYNIRSIPRTLKVYGVVHLK